MRSPWPFARRSPNGLARSVDGETDLSCPCRLGPSVLAGTAATTKLSLAIDPRHRSVAGRCARGSGIATDGNAGGAARLPPAGPSRLGGRNGGRRQTEKADLAGGGRFPAGRQTGRRRSASARRPGTRRPSGPGSSLVSARSAQADHIGPFDDGHSKGMGARRRCRLPFAGLPHPIPSGSAGPGRSWLSRPLSTGPDPRGRSGRDRPGIGNPIAVADRSASGRPGGDSAFPPTRLIGLFFRRPSKKNPTLLRGWGRS